MLRITIALGFILIASCTTREAGAPDGVRHQVEPRVVRTRHLPAGGLKLYFEPVGPNPALEVLRVEEARAMLASLYASLLPQEQSRLRLILASTGTGAEMPAEWELRLRQEYLSRFGESPLPLPRSLETSRLYLALKLSPRHMGEGVREAARELFSSPVFLSSVALSVLVYFAAWLAPEPLFTKAFVVALTVRLSLLVGALELNHFARACLRLYQEAEAVRTVEELEAAAEHFGRAMGGTALRVLMLVASMGTSKALPQVSEGGMRALLNAPRYAMAEGLSLEGATTVRMVADGTVLMTGVAAGTAASAVGSACADGSEKKDGHQWHHLATNKNETSTASGGPWTPLFRKLFAKAGMELDAAENLVYLAGHQGPHSEAYHEAIFKALDAVMEGCPTIAQCKGRLVKELKDLADEICTPGSRLYRLATKFQD